MLDTPATRSSGVVVQETDSGVPILLKLPAADVWKQHSPSAQGSLASTKSSRSGKSRSGNRKPKASPTSVTSADEVSEQTTPSGEQGGGAAGDTDMSTTRASKRRKYDFDSVAKHADESRPIYPYPKHGSHVGSRRPSINSLDGGGVEFPAGPPPPPLSFEYCVTQGGGSEFCAPPGGGSGTSGDGMAVAATQGGGSTSGDGHQVMTDEEIFILLQQESGDEPSTQGPEQEVVDDTQNTQDGSQGQGLPPQIPEQHLPPQSALSSLMYATDPKSTEPIGLDSVAISLHTPINYGMSCACLPIRIRDQKFYIKIYNAIQGVTYGWQETATSTAGTYEYLYKPPGKIKKYRRDKLVQALEQLYDQDMILFSGMRSFLPMTEEERIVISAAVHTELLRNQVNYNQQFFRKFVGHEPLFHFRWTLWARDPNVPIPPMVLHSSLRVVEDASTAILIPLVDARLETFMLKLFCKKDAAGNDRQVELFLRELSFYELSHQVSFFMPILQFNPGGMVIDRTQVEETFRAKNMFFSLKIRPKS